MWTSISLERDFHIPGFAAIVSVWMFHTRHPAIRIETLSISRSRRFQFRGYGIAGTCERVHFGGRSSMRGGSRHAWRHRRKRAIDPPPCLELHGIAHVRARCAFVHCRGIVRPQAFGRIYAQIARVVRVTQRRSFVAPR